MFTADCQFHRSTLSIEQFDTKFYPNSSFKLVYTTVFALGKQVFYPTFVLGGSFCLRLQTFIVF